VAKVGSIKEAILLVTSIAVRPCTGAIFLLIIAWQMDIKLAGALAVIVMGLGTAALTCLVAISSIAARRMTLVSADASSVVFPAAQIFAGALICWISIGLLMVAL
jgi:ABC-type nickel/cobalt efflux system permease component RcnA